MVTNGESSPAGSTVIIANPAARGGAAGKRLARVEGRLRAILGNASIVRTGKRGDAISLAREMAMKGATTILAMGGDGTANEIVNGIMSAGLPDGSVSFGILPSGTGGDFRRLLVNSEDLLGCAKALAEPASALIDVGSLAFTGSGGRPGKRYFLNIASFGVGGLVDRYVDRSRKLLGGGATFFLATLRATIAYRAARVRLHIDGEETGEYDITNVFICNGRYGGGGMLHSPHSRLSDGKFDIIVIRDAPLRRLLGLSRRLYTGEHLDSDLVDVFSGSHVEAQTLTGNDAYLDIDGEPLGTLPAEFTLHRKALRLLNPKPGIL